MILMWDEKAQICTSAKFVCAAWHSTNGFLSLCLLESYLVLLPFCFQLSFVERWLKLGVSRRHM